MEEQNNINLVFTKLAGATGNPEIIDYSSIREINELSKEIKILRDIVENNMIEIEETTFTTT